VDQAEEADMRQKCESGNRAIHFVNRNQISDFETSEVSKTLSLGNFGSLFGLVTSDEFATACHGT